MRCAAGDAVENEQIRIGPIFIRIDQPLNILTPLFDSQLIGDEEALCGVLQELLPELTLVIEAPEHVARRQMDKAGDAAKNRALGAFPDTGLAKEQDCFE